MVKRTARVQVSKRADGRYWGVFYSVNGSEIGTTRTYPRRHHATRAAQRILELAPSTEIVQDGSR